MKVRYCPKCKSISVKVDITASAAFGAPQKWKCMDCGFESYALFPVGELKLKKKENKK